MDTSKPSDLDRVRSAYRFWGTHPRAYAAQDWVTFMARPHRIRAAAAAALGAEPGHRVLEIGCGTGRNFRYVEQIIGPSGALVGVDVSAHMLGAARRLVDRAGWRNVQLVEGDVSAVRLAPESFDAVLAVLALSAVPDPVATLRACHRALRPGGTLAVCDAQPFAGSSGALGLAARALNAVIIPVYGRFAQWHPDRDIPAAMEGIFGTVRVARISGSAFFVATATQAG